MKYCVVKDTVIVIDGSDNPLEIMMRNSRNAGITDFEILTEKEYQARVELEPKQLPNPTLEERITATETNVVTIQEAIDVIFGGV